MNLGNRKVYSPCNLLPKFCAYELSKLLMKTSPKLCSMNYTQRGLKNKFEPKSCLTGGTVPNCFCLEELHSCSCKTKPCP